MAGTPKSGRLGKKKKKPKSKKAEVLSIKCPAKIKGNARAYWKRVVPILESRKAISDGDFFALERMCMFYGEWCKLETKILKSGMTYETTTDRGSFVVKERPEAKLLLSLNKEIKDLERKFGLTPLDRGAIKADQKKSNGIRERY